jgi:uncharacterized SAM-binding protein YcdF (DUF218 family)
MTALRKAARTLYICLFALGLLMVLVTLTPVVPWYARALGGDWRDSNGEVLIVLGGGTIDKEFLATGSYWRAVYAVRAWRQGKYREMVVSGEGVAPLMRDFLTASGVPASAIRMEDGSGSTRENALYTARLLSGVPGRKVLLTSDYHMYRASRAFAKAGMPVEAHPFPDAIKASKNLLGRWDAFLTVARETGKILYYRARGWM